MFRAFAAVALVVATGGAAIAGDYNAFQVGDWQGRAHRSDGKGDFTHCAISSDFPGGVFVTFAISREKIFAIFFGDTEWHLPDEGRYPVELAVDGRSVGKFTADTTGDITLRLVFGKDRGAFEALRRGKSLTIKSSLRNFSLPLKKTARALKRLQDCADTETAAAVAGDPSARDGRAGRNFPKPEPASGPRLYTREEVAGILAKAGISEPVFLSPDEARPYPGFAHMWKADGILGFVAQYLRDPKISVDEQVAVFLANFADSCTGKADVEAGPARTQGAFVFKEGSVSCTGGADFQVRAVAVFETRRLNIFGYVGRGADSRGPTEAATAALAKALRQTFF